MTTNTELDLARGFLEFTGTNIFLTGKAGTGKTTFLHNLRKDSPKRMIVVAPTGVAAIQAGGVTMHSLFQLPLGPYLPGAKRATEEKNRFANLFSKEKINIIRSIDLLVIDEVSMVRADVLDAVSDVLMRHRNSKKPFGGVQLLMIGDLQQLAPVVKDDEWALLRDHYPSPYFFDSCALRSTPYIPIELRQIFRQNDPVFIELLNRVRDNAVDAPTLATLNRRCIPGFSPSDGDGYIILTTHNNTARSVNDRKLAELDSAQFTYGAMIEGDFPEFSYPTDRVLVLKKGAQVMFLKNDPSPEKRYFNGKIGTVVCLDEKSIEVRPNGGSGPIHVELAEWTNTRYTINKDNNEITEVVDGRFLQYPLKTAWAITIHKSQGLTFERAVIDASASFSHGQVYVALSRCRSLEGMVLSTPLSPTAIINDTLVKRYTGGIEAAQPTESTLSVQRRAYVSDLLAELFDYRPLEIRLGILQRLMVEHLSRLYPALIERWQGFSSVFSREIVSVGETFQNQLRRLVAAAGDPENDPALTDRVTKGVAYFRAKEAKGLIPLLAASNVEIDNKETRRTIAEALDRVRELLAVKEATLLAASNGFTIAAHLKARAKALLEKSPFTTLRGMKKKVSASNDIANPELLEILRIWRKATADEQEVPPYAVLHQKGLIGICDKLPSTKKELLSIDRIGQSFMTKYGAQVLKIVKDYRMGRVDEEE
ncbi:MAG: AAA family ATPase [Rikenellaceae bacterium]|jgi:hypothetical protein|nr:AAA family ATPase [Rikenellaceae bacterium]